MESANSPTRSSYGRDYWLRRCEGFLVETPTKRIGKVSGIRYGKTGKPEVLEVRAGLFGRITRLINTADIRDVDPDERRLLLADPVPDLPVESRSSTIVSMTGTAGPVGRHRNQLA